MNSAAPLVNLPSMAAAVTALALAHAPPGRRGEIVWAFNRPGEFDFACLIAGHYSAGMVGRIIVSGP